MTCAPTCSILGPLGPAQLTCIRSWRRRGYSVLFVHVTETDRRTPFIRASVDGYLQIRFDELMSDDGKCRVVRFLRNNNATSISALSYQHIQYLHDLKGDWLSELNVWAVKSEVLPFLESKSEQIQLAEKLGLRIGKSVYLDPCSVKAISDDEFPLVLRPDRTGDVEPAFKVKLVSDRAELEEFIESIGKLNRPLIGQKFIDGRNYVVQGVRAPTGERSTHVGFEVIRMFEGVTLTIRACSLPRELITSCEAYAEAAGITGVYHFEFRREERENQYYFMELNGRLGGTTAKVYRLGYDEPGLMADCFLHNDWTEPVVSSRAKGSNRQALLKSAIAKMRGRLSNFDYPRQRGLAHIFSLAVGFFGWRDDVHSFREWQTSLAYLMDRLVNAIK